MKKITLVSLLTGLGLLLVQTLSVAGTGFAPDAGNRYVPGQILVKFKSGVAAAARVQIAQAYGAQAMHALGNQPDFMLANLAPGQTVEQAVSAYSSDPNVEYAQPDYIYHASAVPNDTQYGQLWAFKNTGQSISSITQGEGWIYPTGNPGTTGTAGDDMNLESAWDAQTDCSTVVVAVVDSGINYNQEDLASNMWSGNAMHGQNYASDGATGDPMDLAGHGTHVAGIIGAVGNNGTGGTGVCWKASLMAVRVLDATGTGSTSTIAAGINYAVSNGAKIINLSLGESLASDSTFSAAITNAQNSGALVVVAAGNSGTNNNAAATPFLPCNFTQSNLVCVAALDQNYALASFSNWGATSVDVGAPGTNILSTWAGTSGTTIVPLTSGWSKSTSTTGGFTYGNAITPYGTLYSLNDPGTWPAGKYTANTSDHVWQTFNLSGTNAAVLDIYAAFHVTSDGSVAIASSTAIGDPFVVTSPAYLYGPYYTDTSPATNPVYNFIPTISLNNCLSATCTLGFALNTGAKLDLGVSIAYFQITTLSLNATNYNTLNGTSMAAPEVTGVAALVWAHNPLYTYSDVVNAIEKGGRSVTALSKITTTGKAVDAMGALSYINPPTGIQVNVQ